MRAVLATSPSRTALALSLALLVATPGGARPFDAHSATPATAAFASRTGEIPLPTAEPAPPSVPTALAAGERHAPGDPLERTNRRLFNTQSGIDRHFFRPIALFYRRVVPRPIRSALRNVIRNITEPVVFVNDVLQLRPRRALRTLGRFTINSTVGIAGAIDVAKTADLPRRNNGFGNTLGRYGVGPGPYLYLPLIGPTTLRDLLGGQIDGAVLPVAVGFPFNRLDYSLSRAGVSALDTRAEADGDLNALLAGAADPYATLRSVYLQSRAAEIAEIRGKSFELAPLDDPLIDPAASDPAVADPLPPEAGADAGAAIGTGDGAPGGAPPIDSSQAGDPPLLQHGHAAADLMCTD